jgi:hypothetical protein
MYVYFDTVFRPRPFFEVTNCDLKFIFLFLHRIGYLNIEVTIDFFKLPETMWNGEINCMEFQKRSSRQVVR